MLLHLSLLTRNLLFIFCSSVSADSASAPVSTPAPALPTASTSSEIDLLGALSDSWAVVPTLSETPVAEADAHANGSIPSFAANPSASNSGNQVDMICLRNLLNSFFFASYTRISSFLSKICLLVIP